MAVGAFESMTQIRWPADPQRVLDMICLRNDAQCSIAGEGSSHSTLTGIALVSVDASTSGGMAFNIGDSRTPRYVRGALEQLSRWTIRRCRSSSTSA